MARTTQAPLRAKSKNPAELAATALLIHLDGIMGRVRRTVASASVEADRIRIESTAITDIVGELLAHDGAERLRMVSVQLRNAAAGMLLGAARLYADAERLDLLADIREIGESR